MGAAVPDAQRIVRDQRLVKANRQGSGGVGGHVALARMQRKMLSDSHSQTLENALDATQRQETRARADVELQSLRLSWNEVTSLNSPDRRKARSAYERYIARSGGDATHRYRNRNSDT